MLVREVRILFFFFIIIGLHTQKLSYMLCAVALLEFLERKRAQIQESVSSVKARGIKQRGQPRELNSEITRGSASAEMSLLAGSAAEGSAIEQVSEDNQNQ